MANIENGTSGQAVDHFLVLQYKKLELKARRAMPGNESLQLDIIRDMEMDSLIATITAGIYKTEPQLRTTTTELGFKVKYVDSVWEQIKVWLSRYRLFGFLREKINWQTFQRQFLVQNFVEHIYPNLSLRYIGGEEDCMKVLCNHQGFYTEEDIHNAWVKSDMPLTNLMLWDTFRKELRKERFGGNGEN